jgi:hypothetical protein
MKLTQEQRAKIEEVLGEDVAKSIYDDDTFKDVVQQRDNIKKKLGELDGELNQLKPRVLSEEDRVDFESWKKTKGKQPDSKTATPEELEAQRQTLLQQFELEKKPLLQELDFFKQETIKEKRDNAIKSAASEFNNPHDAVLYLRDSVRVEIVDGKLVTTVVDDHGKKRFNNDGRDMTPEEAVQQLAKERPYLLKKFRPTGSGAAGGEGEGTPEKTPVQRLADLEAAKTKALNEGNLDLSMAIERQCANIRRAINKQ